MNARKLARQHILDAMTKQSRRKTYLDVERYQEYKCTATRCMGFERPDEMKDIVDALATLGDKLDKMEVDLSSNHFSDSAVPHVVNWLRSGIFPADFTLNLSGNHFSNLGIACIVTAAKKYDPNENWKIELGRNKPKEREGLFANKTQVQLSLLRLLNELEGVVLQQGVKVSPVFAA